MTTVLWRNLERDGLDRCTLDAGPEGTRLAGTVLTVEEGRPVEVRYLVEADEAGCTRLVEVRELRGGTERRLRLAADGRGGWTVSGRPAPELDGCLDVDLGNTPATNTLPIRRLGLAPGQAADVLVARVRFPMLGVEPSRQRYECVEAGRYRFVLGGHQAMLHLGPGGLVLTREGGWQALATG